MTIRRSASGWFSHHVLSQHGTSLGIKISVQRIRQNTSLGIRISVVMGSIRGPSLGIRISVGRCQFCRTFKFQRWLGDQEQETPPWTVIANDHDQHDPAYVAVFFIDSLHCTSTVRPSSVEQCRAHPREQEQTTDC